MPHLDSVHPFDILKLVPHFLAVDVRASYSGMAGLAAEGITIVEDIEYIERGYESFEHKLCSLGAVMEKVSSEKEIQKFKLKVG